MPDRFQIAIGDRPLTIEMGKLAEQAGGAVTLQFGDTVVLVTACTSPEPRQGVDFLPLTVDYEERLYAAGKIPGGFIKREGRPRQDAVLAARLVDRPLRPLFPKGFHNEVQVIITVLSDDLENDPDVLAIVGASTALGISEIPFEGPIAAVRVGYIDGRFVLNPTYTQLQSSQLDLVVAGTRHAVIMVEAGAKEVSESLVAEAIKFGQEANQELIAFQDKIIQALGRPKMAFKVEEPDPALQAEVTSYLAERLGQALGRPDKPAQESALESLRKELTEKLSETFSPQAVAAAFEAALKAEVRRSVLERGLRVDSRHPTDIRPITCEVGTLPRTHGSGLFTRGGTQVLSIVTLGSLAEHQIIDGLTQEESKRFMHHYNFPPFSTGEVKRIGSPGRREIGHGALAERALTPVIPDEASFPYTIRIVSEVLSSNGSTSMASVCGSTLALMDAGVPIKAPVAGVAMGLITEDGRYAVLTDIAGLEDALGDMDFKVAGTAQGLTALQLDIKLKGISHQVIEQALKQAAEARLFVLERMRQTISQSRPELSKYAPRMIKIKINPDKIRFVIGPGGKTIRSIQDEFKVTVEVENDGSVIIGSTSEEAAQRAIKMIEDLTREVEVGGIYTGKVTRITNLGAFVEIVPGTEGLVPLGELADYQAPSVEDVVKVGDEIMVMVTEIDRLGRVNLSRRAVFDKLSGIPGARVTTGQSRPSGPRPPAPRPSGPPPPGQARGPRRPEGRPPEGDQGRRPSTGSGQRYPRDRRREPPPRRPPFR